MVAHADWYGGNTAVAGGVLVATCDWELVAEDEPVIAGPRGGALRRQFHQRAGLSNPEKAAALIQDFDAARGVTLTRSQQRAAAGATAWILAFNARREIGLPAGEGATTALVRKRQEDFFDPSW